MLASLNGAAPRKVKHFSLGNAFSATVTAAQATALAADPAVAAVLPDNQLSMESPPPAAPSPAQHAEAKTSTPQHDPNTPQPICPKDPAKPLVEPEALTSIHAASTDGSPSAAQLATGAGVKVAFIADNIDPNAPDFIRPDGSKVFTDYQDFSGDGPNTTAGYTGGVEGFGDASTIAAQGTAVHDISHFVNPAHPLPAGCNIVVKGIAPGASLVGLNYEGKNGTLSGLLQAIDYAVTVDHVDVLNESLGLNIYPDASERDLLQQFNDRAVAAGVTVVAGSGDSGNAGTIGAPATDPQVLSVGGTTSNQIAAQTGFDGFGLSNGHWISNNISPVSSTGVTQNGRTIDLVAPADNNWATCEPRYSGCRNFNGKGSDLQFFGGTSAAAPMTSGVAALTIQAYRNTHGGQSPSPQLVKQLITGTTTDLGAPADEQGTGMLNARAATEAAMTVNNGHGGADVRSNIRVSQSQVDLPGAPGSEQRATVNVTNAGTKPLRIATGTRDLAPLSTQQQNIAFDAGKLPTFNDFAGRKNAYKTVHFTVKPGAQRLLSRIAWHGKPVMVNGKPTSPVVQLTLLAPDGSYAANNLPQGNPSVPGAPNSANYASVDVRNPPPGQWTAVLYSLTGASAYQGNVILGTDTERAVPYGTVNRPVFTLAPGESKPVTATMRTPASGGDAAYSLTVASSDGHQTSVPVVLRSLVPTQPGQGHFSGTITGGNARLAAPAQTLSYAFDVNRGHRDLDVAVTLGKNAADPVNGVLIDPNGQTADLNSNLTTGPATKGLQLYHANPIPGRWRLVIVAQNPVAGDTLAQPFTGTIGFDRLNVQAPTLPNSATRRVDAGKPITVQIPVHNTGVAPLTVGIDPRTNSVRTLQTAPISGKPTVNLPESPADAPSYLVPPDTTKFTLSAASGVPTQVLLTSPGGALSGSKLAAAQQGSTVSVATVSAPRGLVGTGQWLGSAQEIGPFDTAGAAKGTASYTGSLRTNGVDPTVSSSTGNPFAVAVDAGAKPATPLLIQPGKTGVITVTLTPRGGHGQQVSGHLNLVTAPLQQTGSLTQPTTTGEVITTLPYGYTIG